MTIEVYSTRPNQLGDLDKQIERLRQEIIEALSEKFYVNKNLKELITIIKWKFKEE